MELLYIWIEDYKNGVIREQGFNFGKQYRFHYDCDLNILSMTTNKNYIEDFFKPTTYAKNARLAKITNITAIVGENGTGKSSILDFIKDHLVQDRSGLQDVKALVILLNEQGHLQVISHEELKWQWAVTPTHVEVLPAIPYSSESMLTIDLLQEAQFVFFSNIFDLKIESASKSLLNISTNRLSSARNIVAFRSREIEQQVEFLSSKEPFFPKKGGLVNLKDLIRFPEKLFASFRDQRAELVLNNRNIITNFQKYFQRRSKEAEGEAERSEWLRCINLLQILVHVTIELDKIDCPVLFHSDLHIVHPDAYQIKKPGDFYINFSEWLQEIRRFVHRSDHNKRAKQIFPHIIDACHGLARLIWSLPYHDGGFAYDVITDKDKITELLNLYRQTLRNNNYMELKWRDMSSGERAMLNLFSRFHSIKEQVTSDHLIILIDEGEIYLHPQWQKMFLKVLVEFLPKLFVKENKPQRTIQIILTSNSPFVISDLPASNVNFIKKDCGRNIVIDGLEDQDQTFAANIHALLSHSFFMQDDSIGAFAHEKINQIIDILLNEDIQEINKQKAMLEKMINIIGEPLIRHKLSQLLEEKLPFRVLQFADEFEQLKQTVAELQQKVMGNEQNPKK